MSKKSSPQAGIGKKKKLGRLKRNRNKYQKR